MNKPMYKDIAIKAAYAAGRVHAKYFRKKFSITTKKTTFDLLTPADLEAESRVVSIIKKYFPDHNIFAEENKYVQTPSNYTWIVDPLDGTNNFVSGLPIFSVSIALAKDNEVILGVIYDVSHDELFFAEKGKGAFLNKRRIRVSNVNNLRKSLLITGFYYDRDKKMVATLNDIERFFREQILGLRRLGAAALDLCFVASGRASGYWEFVLSPWDFAAGKLIVEEAGGNVTDKNGAALKLEPSFVVASNGKIHSKMLKVLNKR